MKKFAYFAYSVLGLALGALVLPSGAAAATGTLATCRLHTTARATLVRVTSHSRKGPTRKITVRWRACSQRSCST